MNPDTPLTRETFRRLHPISAPATLSQLPDRVWTEGEWERIRHGYRAQDMDEKWNVFAEGDALFMHRSWTGRGVYEATFAEVPGGRRIVAAVVEGDGTVYRRRSDAYDCLTLELVISAILLGEPAESLRAGLRELTAQATGVSDAPAGVVEHSVLGLRSGS
ncbi:hypothetical protein [Streptomyces sp. NPDC003832]